MKLGFRVNRLAESKSAELYIYGVIGSAWDGMDAMMVLEAIKDLGDTETVDVHLNSPGGIVSEGIAIFNALKRLRAKVTTYNDGLAASMGSIIFQAGDRRVMAEGSLLMIHDPISLMWGNAAEMRKEAKVLETHKESLMSIYLNAGFLDGDKDRLSRLMSKETWLKGEQAVADGLADEVEGEVRVAACLSESLMARLYVDAPKENLAPFILPADGSESADTSEAELPEVVTAERNAISASRFAPLSILERENELRVKQLG